MFKPTNLRKGRGCIRFRHSDHVIRNLDLWGFQGVKRRRNRFRNSLALGRLENLSD